MKKLIGTLALTLMLTGCAAATAEPTPIPTPTPTYATENQVASVISEYAGSWTETIDKAVECRTTWTFAKTALDELAGMTCYFQEQTMISTATLASRGLSKLDIPPTMSKLVDDTTLILDEISATKLTETCGTGNVPSPETACNETLGNLNFMYGLLSTKLAAWGPYL